MRSLRSGGSKLVALGAAFALSASAFGGMGMAGPAGANTDQRIRASLNISAYTLQELAAPAAAGDAFDVTLNLGGIDRVVALAPHSVRAANFQVRVQDATGQIRVVEAPAPATYRGFVLGAADSASAMSLVNGRLVGQVFIYGNPGETWVVQPLSDVIAGAPRGTHVVFRAQDTLPGDWQCGVPDGPAGVGQAGAAPAGGGGGGSTRVVDICQIACDADVEFYVRNGSSIPNTVADIEGVINNCGIGYERDVDIQYEITNTLVRTAEPDPYSTSNAQSLLQQFQNHWNGQQGGIQRDVAHLFTGKNIDGGIIGIAYLSVICNLGSAYGLSESRFTTNVNSRMALTAHELGHNWSAPHCDNQPVCRIMCSGLGGCEGLGSPPMFEPYSAGIIRNFADGRGCLTQGPGNGLEVPWTENFVQNQLDAGTWPINSGGVVSIGGMNEPSAQFSLNLDGADSTTSDRVRVGDVPGGTTVYLSFFTEHRGVEAGKSLKAEFFNTASAWQTLATYTSNGTDQDFYAFRQFTLPANAFHNEFRLRFAAQGADSSDDWYVDNVFVGTTSQAAGIALPFLDTFPATSLNPLYWGANSGALVSIGAVNEVSAPYSVNLDGTDSLETDPILTAGLDGTPFYVSWWSEHRGVEAGKSFVVEVFTNAGAWQTLATIVSSGVDQDNFVRREAQLPANAYHPAAKLRLRAIGADSSDDWFIDDIAIALEPAGTPGLALPFLDQFGGGEVDPTLWAAVNGVTISPDGLGEPSAPTSANFEAANTLESQDMLLGGLGGQDVFVSYWAERFGVEAGESLVLEYFNSSGSWDNLDQLVSDGVDQTAYVFRRIGLPANAFSDTFRIRFRALGSDGSDEWYVDDVGVAVGCATDINGDGVVNVQDFLAFLGLYGSGDIRADFTGDGAVNVADFLAYLSAYSDGCA